MKHIITNPSSYFDELDNYEYVIDIRTTFVRWISSPGPDQLSFNTLRPNTRLVIGGNMYKLQKYIDTKNIIVCGEQTNDELSLFPITRITNEKGLCGDYVVKIKIFCNEDMLQTILKLKLSY